MLIFEGYWDGRVSVVDGSRGVWLLLRRLPRFGDIHAPAGSIAAAVCGGSTAADGGPFGRGGVFVFLFVCV